MRKSLTTIIAVVAFATGVFCTSAFTKNAKEAPAPSHPRITKAIAAMQDAVAYLNQAPDVFQGHKAAAISETNAAIKQLQICEQYPAK